MDHCGAALSPNEQPRAHHGLVYVAISRALFALTVESPWLTPSNGTAYVVLSGLALETSHELSVKRPFPTNTCIYHSLKLPWRCKEAFAASVHLLARTIFAELAEKLLSALGLLCQFGFTVIKSGCCLCAAATIGSWHGRRTTSCCSATLLNTEYFCVPQKKGQDNDEAVESWVFYGCCAHTKFLEIYMYTLSKEKTNPGPGSHTNKDWMREVNVSKVVELRHQES